MIFVEGVLDRGRFDIIQKRFKRGFTRKSPKSGPFGTGPSPILTKIAMVVGIDPKPGHEVLFRQVVSEIF